MIKRGTISPRQVFFILIMLLTGISIMILPRYLVLVTGTDGWLVLLVGGVVGGILLFFINKVSSKYPKMTVVEYAPMLIGVIPGKILGGLVVVYFTIMAAGSLRIFQEMLKAALLPDTPRWILGVALTGIVIWIILNGLEDIARFTELLAPIILFFLIWTIAGNTGLMKISRLEPILQTEPLSVFRGIVSIVSYFGAVIIILMLYPYVNKPEKLTMASIGALLLAILVSLAIFITTVSVFGIFETSRMAWPVIELVKMIRIGQFLERLEALFLSVWLSIAFINISVLGFASVTGWAQLFNLKNYRVITLPLLLILLVLSLLPRDILDIYSLYRLNFTYGLIISFLVPLFLFTVSKLKKRNVRL